jgi:hypothetical protein
MTWEQKFNEIFPNQRRTCLAGEDGIVALYGYKSNLESAVIEGNLRKAEEYIITNKKDFEAYCKAFKLYNKYPGQKRFLTIENYHRDANISWVEGVLLFPQPEVMTVDAFILKASRLIRDYKIRIAKHPKNRDI